MDCGRKYAAAMLRKAQRVGTRNGLSVTSQCARFNRLDERPARIVGFDRNVVWLQHGAVPVTSAVHLLRPASGCRDACFTSHVPTDGSHSTVSKGQWNAANRVC